MWKKVRKRLAIVLSMLIALSAVNFTAPLDAEAATTPPKFTADQIQKKLDTLCSKLNGKYFTKNQKPASYNDDPNCAVTNVIAGEWFKNLFGTYSSGNFPKQYASDGGSLGGYSCFGFASFAEYYLYSAKSTDNLVGEVIFQGSATKANIEKNARVGDILRFGTLGNGHSVILISVNTDNSIKVLDCNWNCNHQSKVQVGNRLISDLDNYGKLTITRASNYSGSNSFPAEPTVSTTTCDEYWTINDAEGVNLRSSYGLGSSTKCVVPNKTQLHVTKKTTSKVDGYTWGYVSYKTYNGWIALELAKRSYLTQTISGPASSYTKTCGDNDFSLGAASSGNGKLSYSSSDSNVVSVDSSGKVTVHKAGTATITIEASATSAYQKASKSVKVTVKAAAQTITGPAGSYTKTVGDAAFSLNAKTSGSGVLSYVSSDMNVASVDASGMVTVVGEGSAIITITAQATDTHAAASKEVTITVKPAPKQGTEITLDKTSYRKTVGEESFSLNAIASSKATLSYASADPAVATVDAMGTVTIHGAGKTVITITAPETNEFLEAKREVTIEVIEKPVPEEGIVVSLDDITIAPGGTGKIPVRLTNNPGFFGINIMIPYDESAMEVTAVTFGEILSETEMSETNVRNGKIYVAGQVADFNNIEKDGVLAYIEVAIKSSTPSGEYEMKPADSFVFNVEEEEIPCKVTGSKIMVKDYIPGDVTSDGKVNGIDVLRLRKYLAGWDVECNLAAADVTGDGRVNGIDVLRIRKYLAGWDVVLE